MKSPHDGTFLNKRTLRIPSQPSKEELLGLYTRELERVGLTAVGDVFIEVQPELFSHDIEVTYTARLSSNFLTEREP